MKKLIITLFLLAFTSFIRESQTSGEVVYSIFMVDTIHNTVVPNDSVQKRFAFSSGNSFWETKYNAKLNNKIILMPTEVTYVSKEDGNFHVTTMPHDTVMDETVISNYNDTNYVYIKNLDTKTILGRSCKNIILVPKENMNFPVQIWYDDSINCNSVIPGAGSTNKNVKGLILEISVYTPIGKNKMVATGLNFNSVSPAEFNPPPSTPY